MKDDEDRLLYLGLGPMLAILLGGGLVPVRGLTAPSNLTFAFLALTILVGELGGRLPALATALVSSLSLDFFLTRPYLRLAIHDKSDLVAFVGLGACGLLAALLGTPRRERDSARARLALVDRALRRSSSAGPRPRGSSSSPTSPGRRCPWPRWSCATTPGAWSPRPALAARRSASRPRSSPRPRSPSRRAATGAGRTRRCRPTACGSRSSWQGARPDRSTCGATAAAPDATCGARSPPWRRRWA
ncbi:MAG: DUF4118 domain-containing protein [Vicinamibacteria bacterium]